MITQQKPVDQLTRKLGGHEKKMQRYNASVCRMYLQPFCKFELGWDKQSVAFISSFIDHRISSGTYLGNGITTSMAGAYFGECIISRYSGKWVRFATGSIEVSVSSLFLVNPVYMVESHLMMSGDKTVLEYYDWIGDVMDKRKQKWTE